MIAQQLDCGLLWVPYIVSGTVNAIIGNTLREHCELGLERMSREAATDRLGDNYTRTGLGLNKMLLYSFLFEPNRMRPVFASGCQKVGDQSVRVFSRYYVFKDQRTDMRQVGLFAKSDNFELLAREIQILSPSRPFIFWSRDRGILFFKRLKQQRPDVFAQWQVHPHLIELLYARNYQGVFYLNKSTHISDQVIYADLLYKGV